MSRPRHGFGLRRGFDRRAEIPVRRAHPVTPEAGGQARGRPFGTDAAIDPRLDLRGDERGAEGGKRPGGGQPGRPGADDIDLGIDALRRS